MIRLVTLVQMTNVQDSHAVEGSPREKLALIWRFDHQHSQDLRLHIIEVLPESRVCYEMGKFTQ
jgi:hypothetical protein